MALRSCSAGIRAAHVRLANAGFVAVACVGLDRIDLLCSEYLR